MAAVIPFRPFESVARQLHRHGTDHLRSRYFRRVHAELAAGHDGKRVAGQVNAERYDQLVHTPDGGAA